MSRRKFSERKGFKESIGETSRVMGCGGGSNDDFIFIQGEQ